MATIARPSAASLLLQPQANGQSLGYATGFLVKRGEAVFLATNWHVVSGRRTDTSESLHPSGAIPDSLSIVHNVAGQLGSWTARVERLIDDDDRPLWQEHPTHGRRVDAVALPLTDLGGVEAIGYDLSNPGPDTLLGAAGPVSVIGFPFGRTGGGAFGIWIQGTVATEPEIDFDDLPSFLIDSRTRPGQSGSPVISYYAGGMVPMADGGSAVFGGPVERFLGIYSGRINSESDLGFVWKLGAIRDIVETGQRPADRP
jgi:hypothetical protein